MSKRNPLRPTAAERRRHERIAVELTSLPTAAGREWRVQAYLDAWLKARSRSLDWKRDADGNLLVTRKTRGRRRGGPKPLLHRPPRSSGVRGHRDAADGRTIDAQFRGGVHDPTSRTPASSSSTGTTPRCGRIVELGRPTMPARSRPSRPTRATAPGPPRRRRSLGVPGTEDHRQGERRVLRTHACDDLAAAAAGVRFRSDPDPEAARSTSACSYRRRGGGVRRRSPRDQRPGAEERPAVRPENSRPFPRARSTAARSCGWATDDGVQPGPHQRHLLPLHGTREVAARTTWQRKLMPGGACGDGVRVVRIRLPAPACCSATTNMQDIDGVQAGDRPARPGRSSSGSTTTTGSPRCSNSSRSGWTVPAASPLARRAGSCGPRLRARPNRADDRRPRHPLR